MKSCRRMLALSVFLALNLAFIAFASSAPSPAESPPPPAISIDAGDITVGQVAGAKTSYVQIYGYRPEYGGTPNLEGRFEDSVGQPDAQGWNGVDLTVAEGNHWHVDTFNAALLDPATAGNRAMWCGEVFDYFGTPDPGYGNDWNESICWSGQAAHPAYATVVRVRAVLNHDLEPDFDRLALQVGQDGGSWRTLQYWTGDNRGDGGEFEPVAADVQFEVSPQDYSGLYGNTIELRWLVLTDFIYSDQDHMLDTEGACQIDLLRVDFDGVEMSFEDFEGAGPYAWTPGESVGAGDFAKVWPKLDDVDPCAHNPSPQFAFIDDGVVAPGAGGTVGDTWTYGPGGYCVNVTGGLLGEVGEIDNCIESPPIPWPAGGPEGALLVFDAYKHLPLWNGIFYRWFVSSTSDPAGVSGWTDWEGDGWIYYGFTAEYETQSFEITGLLPPDRRWVRIRLGVVDLKWYYGLQGMAGYEPTPAPYLDNVAVYGYEIEGPTITVAASALPQDAFPASGTINRSNPGENSCRFDMAGYLGQEFTGPACRGDSIVVEVRPARSGSVLDAPPRMHYALDRNSAFNDWRTSGLPDLGWVEGIACGTSTDLTTGGRWYFDLPDTGFFFPGDIIHIYFEATDRVGTDVGASRLPESVDGFGLFPYDPGYQPLLYDMRFMVRALPSLSGPDLVDQPRILFWSRTAESETDNWMLTLARFGAEGNEWDHYWSRDPDGAHANGLGGQATLNHIQDYDLIIYAGGRQPVAFTYLRDGAPLDSSADLLDVYLQEGRDMLVVGSDVVFDLVNSGGAKNNFLQSWCPCQLVYDDLRLALGGVTAPYSLLTDDSKIYRPEAWIVNGGCPYPIDADAVLPEDSTRSWAGFSQDGATFGPWDYSALLVNESAGSRVAILPYALDQVLHPDNAGVKYSRAGDLVCEILEWMGYWNAVAIGGGDGAVPAAPLTVEASPNPFNPAVVISYRLAEPGELSVRIYDLRGRLVRDLHEGPVAQARGELRWRGRDDSGRELASGVYFCEVHGGGEREMLKLSLVR